MTSRNPAKRSNRQGSRVVQGLALYLLGYFGGFCHVAFEPETSTDYMTTPAAAAAATTTTTENCQHIRTANGTNRPLLEYISDDGDGTINQPLVNGAEDSDRAFRTSKIGNESTYSLPTTANFSIPLSAFGATGSAVVDDRHEYVLKSVNHHGSYGVIAREACILNILSSFSWAPKLVSYNSTSIITSYAGEPLTVFNIPLDYKEQYQKIVEDMKSVGVSHGDIYKTCHHSFGSKKEQKRCKYNNKMGIGPKNESYEVMVQGAGGKNPRFSLVDFGWAKLDGKYTCNGQGSKKAPKRYRHQIDTSVFKNMDDSFRRHLLLEQHLMVDWTINYSKEEVRKVMKEWPNLMIKKIVHRPLYTNQKERIKVFSKFYNQHVDDFRGKTPFNIYFIYDVKPKYDYRQTTKGKRLVNVAMFDFKKKMRILMPGGFKIHATDNIQETKDNLDALGLRSEYQHREFDSLRRVFDVLNFIGAEYVVLRNFERMPDHVVVDPNHLDVDLLVSDYYEVKRVLDGDSPLKFWKTQYENGQYRIVNTVMIDGKRVNFDVRHVGDNYLDERWQRDILQRRVEFHSGIYVPSDEDHLQSLIYHAIIQKAKISDTYVKVMQDIGNFTDAQAQNRTFLRGKLDAFMAKNGYKMVKPQDKTVGYFANKK